jgi:hypothetical protein
LECELPTGAAIESPSKRERLSSFGISVSFDEWVDFEFNKRDEEEGVVFSK